MKPIIKSDEEVAIEKHYRPWDANATDADIYWAEIEQLNKLEKEIEDDGREEAGKGR